MIRIDVGFPRSTAISRKGSFILINVNDEQIISLGAIYDARKRRIYVLLIANNRRPLGCRPRHQIFQKTSARIGRYILLTKVQIAVANLPLLQALVVDLLQPYCNREW